MGRILAIDYGVKRVGLAVTDELKMIANGLNTIHSKDVMQFLTTYIKNSNVDTIVLGMPKNLNNQDTHSTSHVQTFLKALEKNFPNISIKTFDERFTSKIAFNTMIESGINKKARTNKDLLNTISATVILQSYLEFLSNQKI